MILNSTTGFTLERPLFSQLFFHKIMNTFKIYRRIDLSEQMVPLYYFFRVYYSRCVSAQFLPFEHLSSPASIYILDPQSHHGRLVFVSVYTL